MLLSIVSQLGKKAGERAACVKREWRDVVGTAKALGMYRTIVLSVAVGGGKAAEVVDAPSSVSRCFVARRGCSAAAAVCESEDEDGQEIEMPQLGHVHVGRYGASIKNERRWLGRRWLV